MTSNDLKLTVLSELRCLLDEFSELPSSNSLLGISLITELVLAVPKQDFLSEVRRTIGQDALAWLRSGLLVEALFARNEHAYPISMLIALAAGAEDFRADDVEQLCNLRSARAIAMSELPYLTMDAIATHLGTAGIPKSTLELPHEQLRNLIDKRTLRSRSDEYDISALMMSAHIIRAHDLPLALRPQVFPAVLLVRALRSKDINWIAVLALLCRDTYPLAPALVRRACAILGCTVVHAPAPALLPPPDPSVLYSEFLERPDVGLRLRASIACTALLDGLNA